MSDDVPDLFTGWHARGSDPDTSHEAIPKHITAQALRILRSYRTGRPLLDVDAYELAGFGPTARDGQRCSDLRSVGFIRCTGERAKTPSGKAGNLCMITTAGLAYLKAQTDDCHPADSAICSPAGGTQAVEPQKEATFHISRGHVAVVSAAGRDL